MTIHAGALVDPEAELADDVRVGPFAIIEAGVRIASGVQIHARAHIMRGSRIGADTEIHMGAVIGHEPQDLAFDRDSMSFCEIGERCVIREYATIHRPTTPGASTRIGDDCFLMAHAHVAHDCEVGQRVIICNNALIAGHVSIGDRAFISGNAVVHQFCRIGEVAILGGASGVGQDVPPFVTMAGRSKIRSINVVGMRRAGLDTEARKRVQRIYQGVFERQGSFADVQAFLSEAGDAPEARLIRDFYAAPSKRGFCWPPREGEAESGMP